MDSREQSKQLLILAAPSCAGKSTLIEKIRNGQLPSAIEKQLQIDNLSTLPIFEQQDIVQAMFSQLNFDRSMILHYDLFCNYSNRDEHQTILRIAEQFDRVAIVTLSVPSKVLLSRIKQRIIKTFIKICLKPSYFRRGMTYFSYQWSKHQQYRRSYIIDEIYREWFVFTSTIWGTAHWILDSNQNQIEIKPVRVLKVR